MFLADDFRRIARESLNDRWAVAIGTGFLAGLLGASTTSLGGGSSASGNNNRITSSDWFDTEIGMKLFPWIIGLFTVIFVWIIICVIIGGAITLGYAIFNLKLVDHNEVTFRDLFSQFDRFGAGFCMQFLRGLYIFLWSLLLIIPGIIASYSYSMTPYIMAEHPEYGANEAIGLSKEMMKGNKWRLFCMQFSFIGWIILSILTFGIGFLWVGPYMEAANAAFYREVSSPSSFEDIWY